MSEKNVSIMDDLMQAIVQTDEWDGIQKTDPEINRSDKEMKALLCEAKKHMPKEWYLKIEGAICSYTNSVSSAAILYGMHVADAIRDVSARPQDLSRYVMVRTGRATA